jgi:hypothetical protein
MIEELLPDFSTREKEGGIIIKDGNINIAWKESEQLLPSETAKFREGLTKLLTAFRDAGAVINTATFVAGGQTVNLVPDGQHAGA